MHNLIRKLTSNHLLKHSHDENKESKIQGLNKNSAYHLSKRTALEDISNNFLKNHNNKKDIHLKCKELKNSLIKDFQKSKLKSKFSSSLNQLNHSSISNTSYINPYRNVSQPVVETIYSVKKSSVPNTNFINENRCSQPQKNGLLNGNQFHHGIKVSHNYFQYNKKIQKENNAPKYTLKRKESDNENNEILKKCKNTESDDGMNTSKRRGILDINGRRKNKFQEQKEYIDSSRWQRNSKDTYQIVNSVVALKENSMMNDPGKGNGMTIQSKENSTGLQTLKKGIKRSRVSFSPDEKFTVSSQPSFSLRIKRSLSGKLGEIPHLSSTTMTVEAVQKSQNHPSYFSKLSSQHNSHQWTANSQENTLINNNQRDSLVTILNEIKTDTTTQVDHSIKGLKRKRSCSSIHSIAAELKKRHSLNQTEIPIHNRDNENSRNSYLGHHKSLPNLNPTSIHNDNNIKLHQSISDNPNMNSKLNQMNSYASSTINSQKSNFNNRSNNNTVIKSPIQKENSALTLINNSMTLQQIDNSGTSDTMVADIKRNSLLSNYKKRFSSISSSSQEERKEEEKKEKENNILQKNNKNFDKQNDNSFKAINVNTNESFQKSNSLISSTSTLLNSFSFQSSCHPSTIEKAWTTTDKEKSFIHYLKTNTSTNISVTTTDSSKTKKVVYDPISLSEYSSDIFNYMKELEVKMLPDPNYIKHQQEITWNARTILINWIAEVHWKFRMQPETLYLTINIIDRFLSIKSIKLNKFQLLGLCSLLISAKYEEMVVPSIKDLVYMVNHMYTHEEIIQAERCVLVLLGFDLGYPGPMNFLRRISKADGYNTKTRTMAKYLIEITLLDEHFLNCPPSLVASAAVLLARKILFNDQNWNKLFIYYSGYHEHLLIPVAQNIINYALPKAEHSQLPFFKKKYSIDSFKKVSLYVSNWIKNQCAMEKSKEKK